MRFYSGPFPLFLRSPGQYAAQILTFDAFYTEQVLAGFVVIDNLADQPPPVALMAIDNVPDPVLATFLAYQNVSDIPPPVAFLGEEL